MSKADRDNHSDQLNPNNDAYYQSRGYDGRSDYLNDDDEGDDEPKQLTPGICCWSCDT